MKQLRKYISTIILSCFVFNTHAQLAGIYTIGGSSPDYPTIKSAVNDLVSQGISDSVIFKIRDGVYNEQVLINTIPGVSPIKQVVFCSESGDSTKVIIDTLVDNIHTHTLILDSVCYITLKQIGIHSSTTVSFNNHGSIRLLNGSSYNKISNCHISGIGVAALVSSPNTVDSFNVITSNLLISNNLFTIGAVAISLVGKTNYLESGNIVSNNIYIKQGSGGAISLGYQKQPIISNNTININSPNTSSGGIGVSNGSGGAIICNNNIFIKTDSAYNISGLSVLSHLGNSISMTNIYNNVINIDGGKSSVLQGVDLGSSTYLNVFYNTIKLKGTSVNQQMEVMDDRALFSSNIFNNIFINNSDSINPYAFSMAAYYGIIHNKINYNDLFSTGLYVSKAVTPGDKFSTLQDWQQYGYKYDSASISVDPLFADSLLQLQPNSPLCGKGIWVPEVTTDILGNPRNNPPTMGAYELPQPCSGAGTNDLEVEEAYRLKIYPNPGHGKVVIETKKYQNGIIQIHDLTGKLILETDFKEKTEINTSLFTKGMYVVKLFTSEGVICNADKLIIE